MCIYIYIYISIYITQLLSPNMLRSLICHAIYQLIVLFIVIFAVGDVCPGSIGNYCTTPVLSGECMCVCCLPVCVARHIYIWKITHS